MNASMITNWPSNLSPSEWPEGTLKHMDHLLFTNAVFPLREKSGIPMMPSSLFEAHVRYEGKSRHSTSFGARLSDATDFHVSTIDKMLIMMDVAESIDTIGGIGIYFDTNTPMVHIDVRPNRLVWLRTKAGEYVYKANGHIKFYRALGDELK